MIKKFKNYFFNIVEPGSKIEYKSELHIFSDTMEVMYTIHRKINDGKWKYCFGGIDISTASELLNDHSRIEKLISELRLQTLIILSVVLVISIFGIVLSI